MAGRYSPVSPCDALSVALQKCLKAQVRDAPPAALATRDSGLSAACVCGAQKAKKKEANADKGRRSRERLAEARRRLKAEERSA